MSIISQAKFTSHGLIFVIVFVIAFVIFSEIVFLLVKLSLLITLWCCEMSVAQHCQRLQSDLFLVRCKFDKCSIYKCHNINTNHPLPDTATNIWDAQLRRPILTISENLKLFLHLWKDLDKTDSSLSKQMIPRYVLVWLVVKVFFHIKSIMMIRDARCLDLGICLFHLELRCSYAILTNHPYTPDHRKMMMA